MEVSFNVDIVKLQKRILKDTFFKMKIDFVFISANEVKINTPINEVIMGELVQLLNPYGISIMSDPKEMLIQKIKNIINEVVKSQEANRSINISEYISERIGYSYRHMSTLFSELTHTTIENYHILQKIEMAKFLISTNQYSITEIAYKLNYSSTAHLSNQFKKKTGMTPSEFQKILLRKKALIHKVSLDTYDTK
ncbi:AraC family transcriptional regulator [Belliella sp. DSM 111904]|uniref:AraC family transcriptional regulator n=1 Tax=Belliella filtrata TaxID=2923435 RepID=A0ABS9V3L5_9BACT|nr:AraC family transcriptional regulator [Belliella filtrata]MCH7410590.1 AraC family transcriptional regulator [Belliella filtrata]